MGKMKWSRTLVRWFEPRESRAPTGLEVREEGLPGDLAGPQAEEMLAGDLAVDELDAVGLQPTHQGRQGNLRGIGLEVEHRLAAEAAPTRTP